MNTTGFGDAGFMRGLELPTTSNPQSPDLVLTHAKTGEPHLVLTGGGRAKLCSNIMKSQLEDFTDFPGQFYHLLQNHPRLNPEGSANTWEYLMLCVSTRVPGLMLNRKDQERIMTAISRRARHLGKADFATMSECTDTIQPMNKTGQWGWTHQSANLPRRGKHENVTHWGFSVFSGAFKAGPDCKAPTADLKAGRLIPQLPEEGTAPAAWMTACESAYNDWISPVVSAWTGNSHCVPGKDEGGFCAHTQEYNRKALNRNKFFGNGLTAVPAVDNPQHFLKRVKALWGQENVPAIKQAALDALAQGRGQQTHPRWGEVEPFTVKAEHTRFLRDFVYLNIVLAPASTWVMYEQVEGGPAWTPPALATGAWVLDATSRLPSGPTLDRLLEDITSFYPTAAELDFLANLP